MFDFDNEGGFKKNAKKIAAASALLLLGTLPFTDKGKELSLEVKEKISKAVDYKRSEAPVMKVNRTVAAKETPNIIPEQTLVKQNQRALTQTKSSASKTSSKASASKSRTPVNTIAPRSYTPPIVNQNPIVQSSANTSSASDDVAVANGEAPVGGGAAVGAGIINDPESDTVTNKLLEITSSQTDGLYKIGDTITFFAKFQNAIDVSGAVVLKLSSTSREIQAYQVLEDSGTIEFRYVIEEGDETPALEFLQVLGLEFKGSVLDKSSGENFDITLPEADNLLASSKEMQVDGIRPTFVSVTGTGGPYTSSQVIALITTFSESVTISGTPRFQVDAGHDSWTSSQSGTGDTYTFNYIVTATDNSDLLTILDFKMNGGSITDLAGNEMMDMTMPIGGHLHETSVVQINNGSFNILSAEATPGTYGDGDTVSITITLDEDIANPAAASTLVLNLNNGAVATYASNPTPNTLTFNYTVSSGDTEVAALDVNTISGSVINNSFGSAINTGALNHVANGLNLSDFGAVMIDLTPPVLTDVYFSTPDGAYTNTDAPIALVVEFDQNVTVTPGGSPMQIQLNTTPVRYAEFTGLGNGTNALVFNYVIIDGDEELTDLDYSLTAINMNGATITDEAGNTSGVYTLPAIGTLATDHEIIIDTEEPMVAIPHGINFPANKDNDGNDVFLTWTDFSDNVGMANYRIVIYEDPVCTQPSFNGIDLGLTGLATAGDNGIIDGLVDGRFYWVKIIGYDTAGNYAWSNCSSDFIEIDSNAPDQIIISSVDDLIAGSAPIGYRDGDTFDIVINFTGAVNIDGGGPSQLTLNTTPAVIADCQQNLTAVTSVNCTVNLGDMPPYTDQSDIGYSDINSFNLNGAVFTSVSGAAFIPTLPTPGGGSSLSGLNNIEIDNTQDSITNIEVMDLAGTTLKPDATYASGETMSIVFTFDDEIKVTAPITLDINATTTNLNCAVMTDATKLKCDYTVASGDAATPLEISNTSALIVGGSLTDYANNNLTSYTLPANALSDTQTINIDSDAPTITSITSTIANGAYDEGSVITIDVTFSENILNNSTTLTLDTGATAIYTSGAGTNTFTYTYTVGAGENSSDLNVTALLSTNLQDASGNALDTTLPVGLNLSNNKDIEIDTIDAEITNITSIIADGSYNEPDVITIDVTFNDIISGVNSTLTLDTGATATYLSGDGTNTYRYTYTVGPGEKLIRS
jgi:hypothetical protein